MLTDAERAAALKDLEETHAALLQAIEDFPPDHFSASPGEGRWSAAQVLEHVVLVEGRVLGRLKGILLEPPDLASQSAVGGREEELFAGGRRRLSRIQAPPALHPAGDKRREDLLQSFQRLRSATIQFAQETDGDLRKHFFPHPVFGTLDGYQWLRLIPAHCERHRLQIEEIRVSL